MTLSVAQVCVYAVKSCGGWSLASASITGTGFEHDREWVVIENDGYFITQRQYPKMAIIKPELSNNVLTLSVTGIGSVSAPIINSGKRITVTIWENTCDAIDQGDEASAWLSAFLGKSVRLARMAPDFQRKLKEKYQKTGAESVGFADSMPFLLTSVASLDDLNAKLSEKLPMNRFRPNIVVSGGAAFQEDRWKRIKIGDVVFRFAKPCARCEITTVNQDTGEKGAEPLETLGRYRTGPKGIMFGQNLIHEGTGIIKVGDTVEVLE